jgi:DNA-directed RNA polymerase specialized sigma24 family protein
MFEFTTVELNVAKSISRKFAITWREEARNTALEAIWKFRDSYQEGVGKYSSYIYGKAYYYCIDKLRSEVGRMGSYKNAGLFNIVPIDTDALNGQTIFTHAIDYNSPEKLVVEKDSSYLVERFTDKEMEITKKLVSGMTQQDLAEEMGVTPSRVCQIVAPLRQKIKAAQLRYESC